MHKHIVVGLIIATFASVVQAQDTLSGTWEGDTLMDRQGPSTAIVLRRVKSK